MIANIIMLLIRPLYLQHSLSHGQPVTFTMAQCYYGKVWPHKLATVGKIKKYHVVSNVSLDRYKINEVLNEMEVIASEGDVDILQRVCAVVSARAARLAAAGVVAIAKVT